MQRDGKIHYYLLTLTAPGDRAHRMPSGAWCSCTPAGGVDLARWNASHSRRWNHFRTVLRRLVPELEFFRGIEVQDRGALHDHAMVASPVQLSEKALRRMAIVVGFGHELLLVPVQPGSRKAANYVSKYVTKATDQRADVPWWGYAVDHSTGEVVGEGLVDGRYRTWSMSRRWGRTMGEVRKEAQQYAQGVHAAAEAVGLAMLAEVLGAGPIAPDESPPPPS